jgi:hypothetical protein
MGSSDLGQWRLPVVVVDERKVCVRSECGGIAIVELTNSGTRPPLCGSEVREFAPWSWWAGGYDEGARYCPRMIDSSPDIRVRDVWGERRRIVSASHRCGSRPKAVPATYVITIFGPRKCSGKILPYCAVCQRRRGRIHGSGYAERMCESNIEQRRPERTQGG